MQCFYINDRKIFSNQSFSVSDLLVFLNLNIDLIVIEYNKIILPKSLWKQTVIKNNDEVEFVTIVGGG
jgi:thiamine biosynthesis protein ThiS